MAAQNNKATKRGKLCFKKVCVLILKDADKYNRMFTIFEMFVCQLLSKMSALGSISHER